VGGAALAAASDTQEYIHIVSRMDGDDADAQGKDFLP